MKIKRKLTPRKRKDRRKTTDRRNGEERRSHASLYFGSHTAVLNTRQACSYLQISRPTYVKYIATGKINAKKIGRGWKVCKDELDRFVRGN